MPINGPRPRPGGPGEVNLGMYHDRPRDGGGGGTGYAGSGVIPDFDTFWKATGGKMFGTPPIHMARGGPVKHDPRPVSANNPKNFPVSANNPKNFPVYSNARPVPADDPTVSSNIPANFPVYTDTLAGYADGGKVENPEFYQPQELQALTKAKDYGYENPNTDRAIAARTGSWPTDDSRRGYAGGGAVDYTPIKSDPVARRKFSQKRVGYAEGGDVDAMPEEPQAAPDIAGYVEGADAMDPQELDAVLQQIAQLDPNQNEDAVNLSAIVQAAQSGDMERASSILAGFRKRFDSLNAHAQGAAAHGDLAAAAQLAGKAHSQVPDGMQVSYVVGEDGSVIATVTPSGQTFQLDGQQFHDYLVGPATSFDHILENGLEQNLAIASGAGATPQEATGYAEGGVEDPLGLLSSEPAPTGPMPEQPPVPPEQPRGYAEGGPVEEDEGGETVTTRRRGRRGRKGGRGGSRSKSYDDPEAAITAALGNLPAQRYDPGSQTTYSTAPIAPPVEPPPTGYAEGGTVEDDEEEQRRRPKTEDFSDVVRNVVDYARKKFGLGSSETDPQAPSRPLVEPVGGRTALSRGVGYKPAAADESQPAAAEPSGPASSRRVATRPVPAAPEEPRLGAKPLPGPASARRGVEYPEPIPAEDIIIPPAREAGSPPASARTGRGTRPVAEAPDPQRLGSREDISLPPTASPAEGQTAPVSAKQAAYNAAHKAAGERGDIYTTPSWSLDRLTKEAIPDIMGGKLFGRKNTVDYSEVDRQFPPDDGRTTDAAGNRHIPLGNGQKVVVDPQGNQISVLDAEGRPVRDAKGRPVARTYTGPQGEERTGPNTAVARPSVDVGQRQLDATPFPEFTGWQSTTNTRTGQYIENPEYTKYERERLKSPAELDRFVERRRQQYIEEHGREPPAPTSGQQAGPRFIPLEPPLTIKTRDGIREVANPRNVGIQQENQRIQRQYENDLKQTQQVDSSRLNNAVEIYKQHAKDGSLDQMPEGVWDILERAGYGRPKPAAPPPPEKSGWFGFGGSKPAAPAAATAPTRPAPPGKQWIHNPATGQIILWPP